MDKLGECKIPLDGKVLAIDIRWKEAKQKYFITARIDFGLGDAFRRSVSINSEDENVEASLEQFVTAVVKQIPERVYNKGKEKRNVGKRSK